MDTAIGTLLDRLQGLLSKGFLLGGFIPAFLFLLLNGGLAYGLFPSLREDPALLALTAGTSPFVTGLLIVVLTFLLGIALWSLNPWLRQFLEGRYLPSLLRKNWEKRQYALYDTMENAKTDLIADLFDYRMAAKEKTFTSALKEARDKGEKLAERPVNPALVDRFNNLDARRIKWKVIPYSELKALSMLLVQELETNQAKAGNELDRLQVKFKEIFEYCHNRIESDYDRAYTARKVRFADGGQNIGPTEMANVTEVHREYSLQHYGLDIDFFWIRLLKVLRNDAEFYPILEESKTQLDYAVGMTTLIGLTTIAWTVMSFFLIQGVWPFALIFGLGYILSSIFYVITLQSYRSFVEAVRSALDLHRFELLKLLHIKLPKDSREEREVWQQIYRWEDDPPVVFDHGDPAADAAAVAAAADPAGQAAAADAAGQAGAGQPADLTSPDKNVLRSFWSWIKKSFG
jgi:hypothetical protein